MEDLQHSTTEQDSSAARLAAHSVYFWSQPESGLDPFFYHCLVGLVVKASASRAEDPGFEYPLAPGFFRGRVIPVTQKLALQWLPCQAPGVIGSALGLVGPVSVYCAWVGRKLDLQCGSK